ncbi:hypothetical protein C455_17142 [Haloferax larsenii JCM 13917]|nr:hypothetical protein [Haloferax larsenii]ELZ74689.1 hypothetical protein C455_17142 [Haloferax larsenii JCM 13917]
MSRGSLRHLRLSQPTSCRGQTTLAGLAIALVLLTAVTTTSVVLADQALVDATGDPPEQRHAESAASALVTESPLAISDGTVSAERVNQTNASELASAIPALRGTDFRVVVDGNVVATRGGINNTTGTTATRGVGLLSTRSDQITFAIDNDSRGSLDGRTDQLRIDVDPANGTTVRAVTVNDRVVLHRPTGVEGTHTVNVSTYADPTVGVEATGPAPAGQVTVSATIIERRPTRVEVTVDA